MANLTLREAAVALGRSERQVRYMIQQGSLKATKRGLQWVVASEELPLTEVQRREVRERIDRATEAMGRGLAAASFVDLRLAGASSGSRAALALRVEEVLVSGISRLLASNDRREEGTSKFASRFRRRR